MQTLTEKDLLLNETNGLLPIKPLQWSRFERQSVKNALFHFANIKNEDLKEYIVEAWISEFQNLQVSVTDAIKRIRLAGLEKKFGVTEFAIFMNVDLNSYSDNYKQEKKIAIAEGVIPKGFGKAIPTFNHFRDLQQSEYLILDELQPDQESNEGYVLIKNDRNYSVFYSKENFRIIQG